MARVLSLKLIFLILQSENYYAISNRKATDEITVERLGAISVSIIDISNVLFLSIVMTLV